MSRTNGRSSRPRPRGVDLSRAALSDQEAREAQEMLEHQLLKRCNGCGRRITIGMKFTSLDPRNERPVVQLAACTRDDCDFAERCRDGATCMEMFEVAWPDANGPDAPASVKVVARNEELERQRVAAEQAAAEEGPAGG